MQLSGKTIWIISPQPWGEMRISKHHYASTLAAMGNKVFFINPPSLNHKGITVIESGEPNLKVVTYRPVFRGRRYLPSFVYRFLIRLQIFQLIRSLGGKADVVWCFAHNVFYNLKWFHATTSIYHQMDLINTSQIPEEAYTADAVFCVSSTILQFLQPVNKPVHVIQHGLNRIFESMALQQQHQLRVQPSSHPFTVGYSGNLFIEVTDRITIMNIITSHPEIHFVFWGPSDRASNNLGGFYFQEVFDFIEFLKSAPNVTLRGVVSLQQLATEMKEVDMFWLCWQIGKSPIWDGSNSHKILEYLAAGKPVVSHHVSTYAELDLLYMLPDVTNSGYAELFDSVIDLIHKGGAKEKSDRGIQYALNNTYEKQIYRVASLLTGH